MCTSTNVKYNFSHIASRLIRGIKKGKFYIKAFKLLPSTYYVKIQMVHLKMPLLSRNIISTCENYSNLYACKHISKNDKKRLFELALAPFVIY